MNKKIVLFLIFGPLVGLPSLAVVSAGVGAYLLLYTSYPFVHIERGLREKGFEVEGMTGSLNSGVEVGFLKKSDDEADIELRNVKFKYSGIFDLFQNRRLVIEAAEVAKMRLVFKKVPRKAAVEPHNGQGRHGQERHGQERIAQGHERAQTETKSETADVKGKIQDAIRGNQRFPLVEIGVRTVDVRDVEFQHFRIPSVVRIGSIQAKDFFLYPREDRLSLGSLKVASDFIDLQVGGLSSQSKSVKGADGKETLEYVLKMQEPLKGSLKAKAHKLMRKDFNFEFKGMFEGGSGRANASLFDGKISINYEHKQSLTIGASGFTPSDHLNVQFPLSKIFVSATASPQELARFSMRMSGKFKLYDQDFIVASKPEQLSGPLPTVLFSSLLPEPIKAFHVRGGKTFEVSFTTVSLGAGGAGAAPAPGARIRSNESDHPQIVLSDLIFGLPFEQLNSEQQGQVTIALKNFMSPGVPPTPTSMPMPMISAGPASTAGPLACVSPSRQPIKGNYTALDGYGSIHEFDAKRKPLKSLVRAPALALKTSGSWAAVDEQKHVFVAINGKVIELTGGKTYKPPRGLPQSKFLAGVAYDSRRKRLVVLGGKGSNAIYSLDTRGGKWGLLANLPGEGFAGIAYDKDRDKFYALRSSTGAASVDRIVTFGGDLKIEKEVRLRQPAAVRTDVAGWSLTAENGLLVLGGTPKSDMRKPAQASSLAAILDTGCGEWIPF